MGTKLHQVSASFRRTRSLLLCDRLGLKSEAPAKQCRNKLQQAWSRGSEDDTPGWDASLPSSGGSENVAKRRRSTRRWLRYEEFEPTLFSSLPPSSSASPVSSKRPSRNPLNRTDIGADENEARITRSKTKTQKSKKIDGLQSSAQKTPSILDAQISTVTSFPPHLVDPKENNLNLNDGKLKASEYVRSLDESDRRRLQDDSVALECSDWIKLNVQKGELDLNLTLPTGQTFRWRKTDSQGFTGVIGKSIIEMKQGNDGIHYRFYYIQRNKIDEKKFRNEIEDYFNLNISLVELWTSFAKEDDHFSSMVKFLYGARILRQDPLECLFQFICSSNNNISRITSMVEHLSSYGDYLGEANGCRFYSFPSLLQLSLVTEEELREKGFGYRAKYIVSCVSVLNSKVEGGEAWLRNLRCKPFSEAMDLLQTLSGVGPKVAACVALFSLDKHNSIPIDTHVHKLVMRNYSSIAKLKNINSKVHKELSMSFQMKFGEMCGWALNALFVAELPNVRSQFSWNDQPPINPPRSQRKVSRRVKTEVK